MNETVDFYRTSATQFQVRALTAEGIASELRLALDTTLISLDDRDAELLRLRLLVQQQAAELSAVRAQLAAVLETQRRMTLATMIGALGNAIEEGERSLDGRTVAGARAELRAALAIEGGATGFIFAAPSLYPSAALSTVTVDFRPLPPSPLDEARAAGMAAIDAAVQELQHALDRDWSATLTAATGSALAQAGAFLGASARPPEHLADLLSDLSAALAALGDQLPDVRPAAVRLEALRAALPGSPEPAQLAAIAGALRAVVAALGEP